MNMLFKFHFYSIFHKTKISSESFYAAVIKTSNYSNNSFQIHFGQKVLAGHFRSLYEGNFILMTFYPTIGVKGPNG